MSEKSENQLERIAKAAEALVLGLHALTDLLAQKVDAVETPKKSHKKLPKPITEEAEYAEHAADKAAAADAKAKEVAAAAVKEEPKPEPKKEDPKPAPAAAKAKDAGDFPAGAERPIRWAHTRTEFLRHVQKVGQEKAIELLGRYAAKKLSDVAEDKWPALVAECQGKPAPAAAPSPDDLV